MPEYLLPDVGEGLTEAEIVSWKVKVGDEVQINDVVVEIETAKSIVELPSPFAGVVTAILAQEGEMVEVGNPIIAIGERAEADNSAQGSASSAGGEGWGGAAADSGDATAEMDLSNPRATGGGEGESLVGRNKAERAPARRARRRTGADAAGRHAAKADVMDAFNTGGSQQHEQVETIVAALYPDAAVDSPPPHVGELGSAAPRPEAKPPVRKLAKELGVDLGTVAGSGDGGRILREDVLAASQGVGQGAAPAPAAGVGGSSTSATSEQRERREPIKGVRKMMASAMTQSAFSSPHVTEWITVDVTPTMELVSRLKKNRAFADVKVSPLLILARAVILAMRRTPEINSFWDEAAQEVVYKNYVNLGIAAATPRGLVVPNIKDAQTLDLIGLAAALGELTATAREGKTQPSEMSGGTFTITNVGVFGVDAGTPIINPGESAIIAFGAIRKQPWVVEGSGGDEIAIRQLTTLALSFDHRHIDGQLGSQFLADVAGILADPATALLY